MVLGILVIANSVAIASASELCAPTHRGKRWSGDQGSLQINNSILFMTYEWLKTHHTLRHNAYVRLRARKEVKRNKFRCWCLHSYLNMHVSYLFQCSIIFLYEFVVRLKYFCRRHTHFSWCVVFMVLILAVDILRMLMEYAQNTFIMVFIIATLFPICQLWYWKLLIGWKCFYCLNQTNKQTTFLIVKFSTGIIKYYRTE